MMDVSVLVAVTVPTNETTIDFVSNDESVTVSQRGYRGEGGGSVE